jgi:EpsI family protein
MSNRLQTIGPATVLLAGVALISGIRAQHTMKSAKPMAAVSAHFAGLDGRDQVISQEEQKVAGMSDYSFRQFGPDSNPLFSVYVGYYDRQVQGKTIHSPKNCLPGAGWDILSSTRVPAPSGTLGATVNRVVLSNRGTRALVYYWYQGRGRLESSEYVVKWNLLRDASIHGRTEEALVRIVVPLPPLRTANASPTQDAGLAAGDSLARTIAKELEGAVSRVLPVAPGRSASE